MKTPSTKVSNCNAAPKKEFALTRRRNPGRRTDRSKLQRVIEHIVLATEPSRFFELYYWVHEPDLLKIIRRLATLPAETRGAIESFFDLTENNAPITAQLGSEGQLILDAKNIGNAVRIVPYMIDDDEPEPDAGPKPN